MAPKFQLVLLIHAHQPVGNFDDVLERAYQQSYLPFVQALARHPSIRMGLHYTGSLLEWIERAHPEYFDQLRELVNREQVELTGGGYYEPILIAIPPDDRREQIKRLADYLEKHFARRPTGAWLAERVWEPQLPSTLGPAGVDYTLVDDTHLLGAGLEMDQLYGYYLAEDQGAIVKIIPGLKELRYLIPFKGAGEIIQFLRGAASAHPNGFASMGDDLEKFGVWPGTNEHCYGNGWLEKFFAALEQNADWLETATPADAVGSRAPLDRADLPTASYHEMMEWALPTQARRRYHALIEEFASRPDALPFLRGGVWRNFFTKYCESNLLQKKALHVSAKVRNLRQSRRKDKAFREGRDEAATLMLRGQCNDPYWHGVFGGLYTPHLRTALWQSLVKAEAIADGLAHRSACYESATKLDFDADGHDELYFTSDRYAVLLKPSDGATICALDCRGASTNLINSLMRRQEPYHARLKDAGKKGSSVASIHEQTRAKEEGLDRWLNYDRWPRHCFRLLLFGRNKTYQDCATVRLEADAALAGGKYQVGQFSQHGASLASQDSVDWPAEKNFIFGATPLGFEIVCDVVLKRKAQGAASVFVGIETVVNFLAPSAPDRYFESAGKRYPLRWATSVPASELRVVDEWQKISVTLSALKAQDYWISPIETVSESEEGFERIYQGSQVLAVWPVELAPGSEWRGQISLRVENLR